MMELTKQITLHGWLCKIILGRYHDNSISMQLSDAETGEPIANASVCLSESGYTPAKNCTFIKDWNENEGILEALIEADIVEETGREVPTGYCIATEVKILELDTSEENSVHKTG